MCNISGNTKFCTDAGMLTNVVRVIALIVTHALILPTYELASRGAWVNRFCVSILPVGTHDWYKAQDGLWWIGSMNIFEYGLNSVHFLDDPGPMPLAFPSARHSTVLGNAAGLIKKPLRTMLEI